MAVVGEALTFGVSSDEATLVTQRVSKASKIDKKEARNKSGVIVAVSYYNRVDEFTIEGLGVASQTLGSALTLVGVTGVGTVYVEDISVDYGNEDFVKSSVKAVAYEGIGAGS
jgi:hypothetical protein